MATYDNVKFTQGDNVLFIATNKVDENYTNPIKTIAIPSVGILKSEGTTDGTTADKLVDSTADFTTDGVEIGHKVLNTTTHDSTTVSAIDSTTTLSLNKDIMETAQTYTIKAEAKIANPISINLNRIEDRFTINGYLSYGKLDATDTWTSAKDKKDGFKEMMNNGSTVGMVYEGGTEVSLSIEKFQITYVAKDSTDSVDGEAVYEITITGIVGGDIV